MSDGRLDYSIYNREERDICAHLFRLLLEDQPKWRPLCRFLGVDAVTNPRVYCEVALIRDAYFARKSDSGHFMADLVDLVAKQLEVADHKAFNELPDVIKDPQQTHPKQIAQKFLSKLGKLSESDNAVYGAVQAMFNAKPDLAICTGTDLVVFEAKYTLGFDEKQMERTREIGEVWAKLLFQDLGFESVPRVSVRKLGLNRFNPDISWGQILEIAREWWGESDFSTRVFSKVQ